MVQATHARGKSVLSHLAVRAALSFFLFFSVSHRRRHHSEHAPPPLQPALALGDIHCRPRVTSGGEIGNKRNAFPLLRVNAGNRERKEGEEESPGKLYKRLTRIGKLGQCVRPAATTNERDGGEGRGLGILGLRCVHCWTTRTTGIRVTRIDRNGE